MALTGTWATEEVIKRIKGLDFNQPLSIEYNYASLPLCVIDAVFSMGVRYGTVVALIERLTSPQGLLSGWKISDNQRNSGQHSIRDFIALAEPLGSDWDSNAQLTSTKSGIRKTDAVLRFARALTANGIDDFQDFEQGGQDGRLLWAENDILTIPRQRSGISFSYFCMLAGDDKRIKADRQVQRFLAEATNREPGHITPQIAHFLISQAAKAMGKTPAQIDDAIWRHMTNKVGSRQ